MLHHPVTRAPVDTARLLGHILVGEAFSSRLKSPWWQISCGRRVRKRRARRWRPISRWARTWWRVLAPGPRSRRQSRRSKRSPGRKPDKWGCACEREEFEWTNKHVLYTLCCEICTSIDETVHRFNSNTERLFSKHIFYIFVCIFFICFTYTFFFFNDWLILMAASWNHLTTSESKWIKLH